LLRIQNEILRMIANGEPLGDTARQICVLVEAELPGTICSILVVDRAGLLHPLAAPSLPDDYSEALDGMVIGPEVGACGTAAYLREVVIIEDMTVDPRCAKFASRIDGLGVTACWSLPILNDERNTVAVLGLYHRDRHYPGKAERELAEACVDLCTIALRRNERIADRERRANIDALTGLPNRSAFETAMANIPCDEIGSWGLFILDLDNLKVVNDTFGHLAGDALIRTAASRISHVMAPDITFRLGGDEFAVIMQSPELLSDLDAAAARIFAALELPAPCEGHMVVPRATIGGAVLAQGEATAIAVSEAADFALYHAKETGRGGFVRYWPGIGSRITRRRDAIRDVAGALKDDRIEAHYQPVVRLDTGEIIGLEALCRMRTVDGELITAADFHEATTDAHVAAELTEQMLAAVAGDIRHWLDSGIPVQHVGINVSTADFYTGSIGKKLESAFDRAGVSLKHLVLEVSEDVYLGRRDRVVAKEIESLRAAGVLVALDDFGTGYASLTHLLSVPVDIIKIDQTFVARLWPEDPSMVIVEGLIDIARRLDIRVVAEGIETEVQASQLWSMGCHLGQGFAFARPGDRVTTERLLRRHAQGMVGTVPLYPVSLQAPASSNGSVAEQKLASPHRRASVG
jgi:diguanylate cyclase (GGDEF)-like protein